MNIKEIVIPLVAVIAGALVSYGATTGVHEEKFSNIEKQLETLKKNQVDTKLAGLIARVDALEKENDEDDEDMKERIKELKDGQKMQWIRFGDHIGSPH